MGGELAPSDAGRRIALQYAAHGARWRPVATTTVETGGRYRFRVRLKRSGALRIALPADGGPAVAAADAAPASPGRRIAVAGRLVVGRRGHDVQAGEAVHVHGTLLPRTRGRRVVVEAGSNGRWHAVAHARTRGNGHFDARVATALARLAAAAGALRGRPPQRRHARAAPGRCRRSARALASWYGLYGGTLALRRHAAADTLGVANKYAAVRHAA